MNYTPNLGIGVGLSKFSYLTPVSGTKIVVINNSDPQVTQSAASAHKTWTYDGGYWGTDPTAIASFRNTVTVMLIVSSNGTVFG